MFRKSTCIRWRLPLCQRRLLGLERSLREGPLFLFSVAVSGLERDRALDGTRHGDTRVPRRIAVAIAGRSGGTGLGEPPGGSQELADRARLEQRIRLAARPDALHGLVRNPQE